MSSIRVQSPGKHIKLEAITSKLFLSRMYKNRKMKVINAWFVHKSTRNNLSLRVLIINMVGYIYQ